MFGNKNVEIKLKNGTVTKARNSVSLGQIRMDRIVGVSDVTVDSQPISIDFNPMEVANRVRANFAANSTRREMVGNTEMFTDEVSKKRIAVSETGKATLFDNGKKVVYASYGEAERAANMNSVALADQYTKASETYSPMYAKFAAKRRNAFTARSKPREGMEKEHAEAKANYEKFQRKLDAGIESAQDREETKIAAKHYKELMASHSTTYHTTGNVGASGSFNEDPFIKALLDSPSGRIMSPSKAKLQSNWEQLKPYYDYFNSQNYQVRGKGWSYLANPTHNKIFAEGGRTPGDVLHDFFQNPEMEGTVINRN
jgi:hypothetical protein